MHSTDETHPNLRSRLKRIEIVSRFVRFVILGMFIISIGYWSYRFVFIETWQMALSILPIQFVLCGWYWKLAKLFWFYERGLIFDMATIRCIKTLGILCVVNWLLFSINGFENKAFFPPPPPSEVAPVNITPSGIRVPSGEVAPRGVQVPSGYTMQLVKKHNFSMGFFSFTIYGINIGLLLAGIIIVIIAWVMDEGRKIQQEQALTV